MIMTTLSIFTILLAIVAIDEMRERKYVLGEEWDFLTHYSRRTH